MFLVLNFLAATQDIIVDGWALTMLKKFVFVSAYKKKVSNKYLINLCIYYCTH